MIYYKIIECNKKWKNSRKTEFFLDLSPIIQCLQVVSRHWVLRSATTSYTCAATVASMGAERSPIRRRIHHLVGSIFLWLTISRAAHQCVHGPLRTEAVGRFVSSIFWWCYWFAAGSLQTVSTIKLSATFRTLVERPGIETQSYILNNKLNASILFYLKKKNNQVLQTGYKLFFFGGGDSFGCYKF